MWRSVKNVPLWFIPPSETKKTSLIANKSTCWRKRIKALSICIRISYASTKHTGFSARKSFPSRTKGFYPSLKFGLCCYGFLSNLRMITLGRISYHHSQQTSGYIKSDGAILCIIMKTSSSRMMITILKRSTFVSTFRNGKQMARSKQYASLRFLFSILMEKGLERGFFWIYSN